MDVYQVSGNSVQIETEDVDDRFLYNPETGYLLLPADVYGSLSGDELSEIRNHPEIEGVYNHACISPASTI